MPTISNALLRDPSFPLIVPLAEWMTPQVTKNFKFENSLPTQQQQLNATNTKQRPRAVSLQIPFMGGTIVPPNHANLARKFRIRRNSVPPQHASDERYSAAYTEQA